MSRHRSPNTKSIPRIMIEVTEEQFYTFKKFLPYGFQKQVFSAIVEDMCRMWEEFGDEFTRAMITKNLTYRQFMGEHLDRAYGDTPRSEKELVPITHLGRTVKTYQRNPKPPKGEKGEEGETLQDGQSDSIIFRAGDKTTEEYC